MNQINDHCMDYVLLLTLQHEDFVFNEFVTVVKVYWFKQNIFATVWQLLKKIDTQKHKKIMISYHFVLFQKKNGTNTRQNSKNTIVIRGRH